MDGPSWPDQSYDPLPASFASSSRPWAHQPWDPTPSARRLEKRPEVVRGALDDQGGVNALDGLDVLKLVQRVMDSSRGRDKLLKCVQYSLRSYAYVLTLLARVQPLPPWFRANSKRVRLAISGLSLTRKCLLLLNPLHPLTELLSPHPTSAPALLRHLLDLVSTLSDDVYCLSRLGLVSRKTGTLADRWANRFWLITTLFGLLKIHSSACASIAEANRARWSQRKYLADLVFSSYEVFHVAVFREPVECVAGLMAAFISSGKILDDQWRSGLGKG